MIELKKQYNKLLQSHRKAVVYFDDDSIPLTEKEKIQPRYKKITDTLNTLLLKIKDAGFSYTQSEALEGFKEDDNIGIS